MSPKTKPDRSHKKFPYETKNAALQQAILRKVPPRVVASGEVLLPAAPALVDYYVDMLHQSWRAVGRIFTEAELDYLRGIMKRDAETAFAESPYSRICVSWHTDPLPKTSITWTVSTRPSTIEDEYADWVNTRTPPLFGEHPDAKVLELCRSFGSPAECPVLDVGAGTGRNTLPLARLGHPTDAVELSAPLADVLRAAVAAERLEVDVIQGDVLDPACAIRPGYKLVVLAEVVASHFRDLDQVRRLF